MRQPEGFYILSSCDSVYFLRFGRAFINSCIASGNRVHVHVMNPDEECLKLIDEYEHVDSVTFSYTFSVFFEAIKKISDETRRVYYACNRFLIAPHFLAREKTTGIFICDIDTVVMKKIEAPEEDIGLFLRESLPGTTGWEAMGTRVAAGCVYLSTKKKSKEYIDRVANHIRCNLSEPKWFMDQVALAQAYDEQKKYMTTKVYDESFMGWEDNAVNAVTLFTGKGPRKDNAIHTQWREHFENLNPRAAT